MKNIKIRLKKRPRRTLPRKFSNVIKLALRDVEIIKKNKTHSLNLDFWYILRVKNDIASAGTCSVCFAGAVMITSLMSGKQLKSDMSISPYDFSVNVTNKLYALNTIRLGHYLASLLHFYNKVARKELTTNQRACLLKLQSITIESSFRDKDLTTKSKQFNAYMQEVITILQEYKL